MQVHVDRFIGGAGGWLRLAVILLPGFGLTASPGAAAEPAVVRYEAESAGFFRAAARSEHPGFSGRGYVNFRDVAVGVMPGGYVEWTVDAPVAGPARLEIRYSAGANCCLPAVLTVNGRFVREVFFFPTSNPADWTSERNDNVFTFVRQGSNTIRLANTVSNGTLNIDALDFSVEPGWADYQAEDAVVVRGAVESHHPEFTGRGYVNTRNVAGAAIEWTVNAPIAGPVTLIFRYANATDQSRDMVLTVNGSRILSNPFPGGSDSDWSEWLQPGLGGFARLRAGRNVIRLTAETPDGAPNVDTLYVRFDALR